MEYGTFQAAGDHSEGKDLLCQGKYLSGWLSPDELSASELRILLLPDSVSLEEEERYRDYVMGNYRDKSKEFAQEMDQDFARRLNPEGSSYAPVWVTTQSAIYDDSIGTSAMYIFLGLYLGICFLISGSAVLALKILSDSADSRESTRSSRSWAVRKKRSAEP